MANYPCPCCGYITVNEKLGHFADCPVCCWEDDPIQSAEPDYEGGANAVSLRVAQQNFLNFGASEERLKIYTRLPNQEDHRDPDWRQLN